MKLLLAVLFVPFAAAAEPIALRAGAGLAYLHVPAEEYRGNAVGSSPSGLALSLDAQLESGRFFLALSAVFAGSFTPSMASGRAGFHFLDGALAPYLAAGAGYLRETLADGDLPPNQIDASGAMLLAEIGLEARRRPLAIALYAQAIEPLFGDAQSPGHGTVAARPCYLAGARILF